ncbi:MAG: hypothetical protein QOK22_826 [Gaiellaceae bacterium]|nr:hypothetical protein [Gaiellaceae bacterium]
MAVDASAGDVSTSARGDARRPAGTRTRIRTARRAVFWRIAPPVGYVALAAACFASYGIPLSRDWVLTWILGGLLCCSVGSMSRFVRSLLTEWLPLAVALTLYDVLRGVGAGRFPIHGGLQIWIDRHVFGLGSLPTLWLQEHLWNAAHLGWYDFAAWGVYTSYYLVTPLALAVLWLRRPQQFRRYVVQLTSLAFISVAVFTVWPTIPPWLASEHGTIGPVAHAVGPISRQIHFVDAGALWERGLTLANDLAAFPSLHEAMTLLVSVVFWRRSRPLVRVLLVLYPLAMAFSLVYLGEHYVTDFLGSVVAVVLALSAERRLRRLHARFFGSRARGTHVVELKRRSQSTFSKS